jgi:RNA polymerase sigma-70 factor (ECF subfamily)
VRAVTPDDETLVARVLQGDQSAFSALYRKHVRYLAGVAYRIYGDDVELEDTIQEVFLEAHRGLHNLTDPKRLRPWLVTIAVRRSQKRIGKRVRRRALAAAVGQSGPKCGDQRDQARVNALYEALDQIAEQLRVPWILRNVEGYSLAETAEICGISVATVKRRLNRAQTRIDRRLEGGQGGRP